MFLDIIHWHILDLEFQTTVFYLLKSNFLTSKGGSRKGHTVFTEQGVAMLATIIKTSVAIETSIKIMDAFVSMRHYISNSLINQKYYNQLIDKLSEETGVKLRNGKTPTP